jgi:hypothetical protein
MSDTFIFQARGSSKVIMEAGPEQNHTVGTPGTGDQYGKHHTALSPLSWISHAALFQLTKLQPIQKTLFRIYAVLLRLSKSDFFHAL